MRSIRTSRTAKGSQSMPRSRSQTAINRPGRGQPGTFSKRKRATQSEACSLTAMSPFMAAIMAQGAEPPLAQNPYAQEPAATRARKHKSSHAQEPASTNCPDQRPGSKSGVPGRRREGAPRHPVQQGRRHTAPRQRPGRPRWGVEFRRPKTECTAERAVGSVRAGYTSRTTSTHSSTYCRCSCRTSLRSLSRRRSSSRSCRVIRGRSSSAKSMCPRRASRGPPPHPRRPPPPGACRR